MVIEVADEIVAILNDAGGVAPYSDVYDAIVSNKSMVLNAVRHLESQGQLKRTIEMVPGEGVRFTLTLLQ